MTELTRAAIYARVSTDEQRSNTSIPNQLRAAREYAHKRGLTLVGDRYYDLINGQECKPGENSVPAFVDDFTGTELERPGLDDLFQYLEDQGFDVMLVLRPDRLDRSGGFVSKQVETRLRDLEARLWFVERNYTEDASGKVMKSIDSWLSQIDNIFRIESFREGKKGKAIAGRYVGAGKIPYGYTFDKKTPGGLIVDEQQAGVVQRIFHMYIKGHSMREIAEWLTREGVSNWGGNPEWAKSTVKHILINPIYAGEFTYNLTERVSKRKTVPRLPEEWVKVATPAIVTREEFNAVQARMRENQIYLRKQPKRFYLLSGMVFCAECSRPYFSQTRPAGRNRMKNDGLAYRHRIKNGGCRNHQVSARILEPAVWVKLVEVLKSPDTLREGHRQYMEKMQAEHARQYEKIVSLQRETVRLELQKQKLSEAYTDPEIAMPKDEYLALRKKIDGRLIDLNAELESLQKDIQEIPSLEGLEEFEKFAEEIQDILDTEEIPPETQRDILKRLHAKVLIYGDNTWELVGWFSGATGIKDNT